MLSVQGSSGARDVRQSMRSAVCHITNSRLSDGQWLQASLPVREGGLGVGRVASLALPTFLASAASTLSLQASILTGSSGSIPDCHFLQAYLLDLSARFGTPPVARRSTLVHGLHSLICKQAPGKSSRRHT